MYDMIMTKDLKLVTISVLQYGSMWMIYNDYELYYGMDFELL